MKDTVKKRIDEWTKPPFDHETINEILKLKNEGNDKELTDRFYRTLEFGTGGLRGVIGAGTNRMNIYTVGMATQGLANYILSAGGKERGVVIARDSRRFSDLFARETASIMAGNGIPVFFFEEIAPTPLASFAIRHLKAVSGVVVTASHNPPEYNGYKVYWDDGGQIVPPHDKLIIDEVNKISDIGMIRKADFKGSADSGLISMIDEEVISAYISRLEGCALREPGASEIAIAYTPLHGTGYSIVPRVLRHFGFNNVTTEKSQSVPDGNFPTVKYPNPEERDAMELVTALARESGADIIMATDPDADRMGVGFRDREGEFVLINGNQIGTMLEYYLLSRSREKGTLPGNGAVIKTIVTTELQREIALDFGCAIDDVLTGFKWIAAKMKEYDEQGKARFIFGGEESYGYLPVNFVRDKDAISACYFFAEMTDWLKKKGMSLIDFLDEIYATYGLYLEDLHSLTLKGIEGSDRIQAIMNGLRSDPPGSFSGVQVSAISDVKRSVRRDMGTGKEEPLKDLPVSDVLQFHLEDGSKITMRPSGTEPKIKFYFSVREKAAKENLSAAKGTAREKLEGFRGDLLRIIDGI